MLSNTTPMESLLEFLNSEKSLFLFAGIIGAISLGIGLLFLLFSNHKSFALTMLVLGAIEMTAMFPTYITYQQKINAKVAIYERGDSEFAKVEILNTEKALKSFFKLKLLYGFLIILLVLAMSFLSYQSLFFGVFTALILHLALAITIDNFGESYSKKYLTELKTE